MIRRKALSKIKSMPSKDKRRLLDAIKAMNSDPFSGDAKSIKGLRGRNSLSSEEIRVLLIKAERKLKHAERIVVREAILQYDGRR